MFIRFIYDLVDEDKNYKQFQLLNRIEAILIRVLSLEKREKIWHNVSTFCFHTSKHKSHKKKKGEVYSWLKEYEIKEKEVTKKALEKLTDRIARSEELGIPSVTELTRIPYEDKFQFRKLVAYQSIKDIPLKLLLPFNEQVITLIGPEKRRKTFIQIYGLTPEEVAHLYDKGRILPILTNAPIRFRELSGDYMDVLLEKKPPTYLRTSAFCHAISGGKFPEYFEAGERLAQTVKSNFQEMSKRLREAYVAAVIVCYSNLSCLGLNEIVNNVFMEYEPVSATRILLGYDEFLSDPIMLGLGTIPQRTKEIKMLFSRMMPESLSKVEIHHDALFPVEVGRFLTDFYDLTFPANPTMEIVDKMYRDKALIKARKLLYKFDRAVHEGKGDTALERGKDLKNVFMEAYEALPALDKRVEKCEWTLNAVAYGAVGLLGVITHPTVGLLAGMGYRVAEKKFTGLVAPKLARIRFNPLSTAIWDFRKAFKNIEEMRKELEKIRKLENRIG